MKSKSLFFLLFLALVACQNEETITDIYYIQNGLEDSVVMNFSYSIFWDTCSMHSAEPYSYVRYESDKLTIPAHSTVRLHPIIRRLGNPTSHQLFPIEIIGPETKLIVRKDTITWHCDYRRQPPLMTYAMFTSDTIWSIYNTESWQTKQSEDLPYTYCHTFRITQEGERSAQ